MYLLGIFVGTIFKGDMEPAAMLHSKCCGLPGYGVFGAHTLQGGGDKLCDSRA